MGYHPYSYPLPQHVSGRVYCQNVSYGANQGVHQVYNNMAPIMGKEAMNLNKGSSNVPNLFDYNRLPLNKTIKSESVEGPVTMDPKSSNGLNSFMPHPFKMSITHSHLYNQSSTASDSGLSDRSTDSDWEDHFETLLGSELGGGILIP